MTNTNLDLVPLSKFNEMVQPYPTVAALRMLQHKNTNDFRDKVIRKVGKRVYIKVSALEQWIDENGKVA